MLTWWGSSLRSTVKLRYWRERAKSGDGVRASVVHTTSVAGFAGNYGQAAYSAAKAAVLGLSRVVSLEGAAYGVRSNAISPSASTRMGGEQELPGLRPSAVSPLVSWLATENCPADGQIFHCMNGRLAVVSAPRAVEVFTSAEPWTLAQLDTLLRPALLSPPAITEFLGEEFG
ncbi:SDR family NAD(P)-dependent oxidoreductase [Amycolatopsis jejuensis]|uniref:SDR family NAD(P)-dependent oxidoreductase n=1 Tax=Amycolatopsis jejuensis TaxID=330084 RepID=UPI000B0FD17F|nr:SDR family NAD(P)-dependent oxidoreductase [Amycolatopsis jejuensis]